MTKFLCANTKGLDLSEYCINQDSSNPVHSHSKLITLLPIVICVEVFSH